MTFEYGYKFVEKAVADLNEIVSYMTVRLQNPQAASRFLEKLQNTVNEARCFPESGSLAENELLLCRGIRKKAVKNYIMYYLPDAETRTVFILRIVYGKRNLDEIVRDMNRPN